MTAAHAVRPAVLADAGAIARVHVAAWQHAYRGMLPAELLASLSVAQRTQHWHRQLAAATMSLVTGYGAATLWVLDANARARRFYERHGWRPDGARQQEVREDAVLEEIRYRLDR